MSSKNTFPWNLTQDKNLNNAHYISPDIVKPRIPLIDAEKKRNNEKKQRELDTIISKKRLSGINKYFVNIDSRRRIKKDQVIIGTAFETLTPNPLIFTEGSKIMQVYYKNHGLETNDHIFITNASPIIFQTVNPFEARDGTNFVRIEIPGSGHNLTESYNNVDNLYLQIQGATNQVSNFSPSLLNGIFRMYLTCNFSQFPDGNNQTNNISSTVNTLYLYIQMPNLSNSYYSDVAENTNINVTVKLLFLSGVPIANINNGSPQDIYHLKEYQTVSNIIDENNFTIALPQNALTTQNYGGKLVKITNVDNIIGGNPDPNEYRIDLGRTFNNVMQICVVDSVFPKSMFGICSIPITKTNNKLYWKDIEDINIVIYTLEVTPGYYNAEELAKEIEDKALLIPRTPIIYPTYSLGFPNIFSPPTDHYFKVNINAITNVVSIKAFLKTILVNSMFIQRISGNETRLYIILQGHSLQKGQEIIITDAPDIGGVIPASAINGTHIIDEVNELKNAVIIDPFLAASITYLTGDINFKEVEILRVILPAYNQLSNPNFPTDTITYFFTPLLSDVVTFSIYTPTSIQLMFSFNDTLGTPLGFRRVGDQLAITNFLHEITNSTPYADEINLQNNFRQNAINLQGDPYIFLCCPQLISMYNTQPVKNAVFKIQLSDEGNYNNFTKSPYIYNTMINSPVYFEDPIPKLSFLDLSFRNLNNSLYDFQGLDHSFLLEIYSIYSQPDDIDVSSRKGTIGRTLDDPTKRYILRNHLTPPNELLK